MTSCGHTLAKDEVPVSWEGEEMCPSCYYKFLVDSLKRVDVLEGVYLSEDEKYITTWEGRPIARVTKLWWQKVGFSGKRYYFHAEDVYNPPHGWTGTTQGPRMPCRMRKARRGKRGAK